MNLIYLSPSFPPNFQQFVHSLAYRGVNVLGIGEEPFGNLPQELKESLKYYYEVSSIDDYEQVYRAVGFFIHNFGRIDYVESHNEHWMNTEAKIREDFNLSGPNIDETHAIKRKSQMKKKFIASGAPVVDGILLNCKSDMDDFIKKHGYPIFAKPDVGVGAVASFKIESPQDQDNFWKNKTNAEYFAEPFIDGRLQTFDGICDQNGKIIFTSSLFSVNGAFDLVAYNKDLSFYIIRDIPNDIVQIGTEVIKNFNIRSKFFHLEFLRDYATDKLYVLEINCRPPGGYTVDLMNFSTDLDLYQLWADVIAFGTSKVNIERKYFAAHISRKRGKSYCYSIESVYNKYSDKIMTHLQVPEIFSEVMGNETFLCRSKDEKEINDMILFIQDINR